ncbi:hypothetical protein ABY45_10000 [Microbacterium maritypicum]|uniref:hypothetical protein n=1 Tax=Microbacterium maritypicum TaxID=33918 RepID=UPI003D6F4B42
MSRAHLLPVIALSALALAGCSAGYEGASPADFASTACGAWVEGDSAESVSSPATVAGLSGSGEEQRDQAIELAEGIVAEWEQHRDAIESTKPAVEDGDATVALFTDYYNTRIDGTNELIDDFRGVSTETGEFDEQVRQAAEELFYGIEDTGLDATFPFTEIKNQELVDAFLTDETCKTFLDERGW